MEKKFKKIIDEIQLQTNSIYLTDRNKRRLRLLSKERGFLDYEKDKESRSLVRKNEKNKDREILIPRVIKEECLKNSLITSSKPRTLKVTSKRWIIKGVIKQIIRKEDINHREYLVIELDSKKIIFVFFGKEVWRDRANELKLDKEYSFLVRAAKNEDSEILVDFEISESSENLIETLVI